MIYFNRIFITSWPILGSKPYYKTIKKAILINCCRMTNKGMSLDDDLSPIISTNYNTSFTSATTSVREEDFKQLRDLDDILIERAMRFHDPAYSMQSSSLEPCILVAVDTEGQWHVPSNDQAFSLKESLQELSELVGTAGLEVMGTCIQKLQSPNQKTYVGPGKAADIVALLNATRAKTIVIDDDLTPKQQRNLETSLQSYGAVDVKVLDRTAVILDIFAQHAKSREGQLQTELAMLDYRMTRGPKSTGTSGGDKGAGFRGPGESKLELDKRVIKDKMLLLQKEISSMGTQRELHRQNRRRLGLPLVALVGYTNAGKSTVLNVLSRAGVLAENMLFATLDPTTRRVKLPKPSKLAPAPTSAPHGTESEEEEEKEGAVVEVEGSVERVGKGSEILLTDTVGFISKLPTNLVAAFRATLEEVDNADILIHVIDRSNPVWEKHRETVLCELDNIGCSDTVVVELWNKIDALPDPEAVIREAASLPIDVDAYYAMEQKGILESGDKQTILGALPAATSADAQSDGGRAVYNSVYGDEEDDAFLSDTIADPTKSTEGVLPKIRLGAKSTMRYPRKTFTVAASALKGMGMNDFITTLESALSTLLVKMDVFVPYDKDEGVVSSIHQQGAVDAIEYRDTGTFITCRIGSELATRLERFRVEEGQLCV